MKYILTITLMCLSLVTSAQISFTSTDGNGRKKHHVGRRDINSIAVFLEKSEVPPSAKRIGIISILIKEEATALFEAKKLAAQVGGDGVLVVKVIEGTNIERGHRHKQRYGYWVYQFEDEPKTGTN